jgi:acyl carrier protein
LNESQILAGIAEVARRQVGVTRKLEPGQSLQEDLLLDSLQMMTLAVEIENLFRVRLDPEDEAGVRTVGDLIRVVAVKLGAEGR